MSDYRVIVSPRAFSDLDAIFDHIKTSSPANAVRTVDRLQHGMQALESFPLRYRVVAGGKHPRGAVRRMPVSSYLVYYRVLESQRVVRIVTIRHGARRQPRRFE
jgi:toxin ParE1/3/4